VKLQLSFDRVAGYPIVSTPLPDIDIEGARKAVLDSLHFVPPKKGTDVGIQLTTNHFMDPPLVNLFHTAFDSVCFLHSHFLKEPIERAYQNSWLLILDGKEEYSAYHEHVDYHKQYSAQTVYTWTYYIQTPDNCEGDEGKLGFRLDKMSGDPEFVTPKEGYLYIFPSAAWHQPYSAPNSTKQRITAAGNIHIPITNKSFLFHANK